MTYDLDNRLKYTAYTVLWIYIYIYIKYSQKMHNITQQCFCIAAFASAKAATKKKHPNKGLEVTLWRLIGFQDWTTNKKCGCFVHQLVRWIVPPVTWFYLLFVSTEACGVKQKKSMDTMESCIPNILSTMGFHVSATLHEYLAKKTQL